MTEPSQYACNVNGARIHIAEQGDGPLVVLVHGFPELWYSWRHQLPALAAAGYRAVAIDQRGYGRSSKFWQPEAYRIDKLTSDLVGVVAALGESQAVIVGHDWGAPVVWSAAWMYPEVFRGVLGMSVPFAGRAMIGVPGNPFGERAPDEYQRDSPAPVRTSITDTGARSDRTSTRWSGTCTAGSATSCTRSRGKACARPGSTWTRRIR
jgi:pimeloyl-ACP methyl ester carboxylesterase